MTAGGVTGPRSTRGRRGSRWSVRRAVVVFVLGVAAVAGWSPVRAQVPQNPSPMVDATRPHPRIDPPVADATRESLSIGTLFVPGNFGGGQNVPLVVNFHGTYWVGEHYISQLLPEAVLAMVPLGAGSSVYNDAFADPAAFSTMLEEIEMALGWVSGGDASIGKILLASFSAGYGATRAVLRHPEHYDRGGRNPAGRRPARLVRRGRYARTVVRARTRARGGGPRGVR